MAKGNRKVPEINSSSTADIAFIILIFFLITTSMDTDMGLTRLMPPPQDEKTDPPEFNERNILTVKVNFNDELIVGDTPMPVDQLKDRAKEFIANPYDDPKLPEKTLKNINYFGDVMVSKGIISLVNDRQTSYHAYMEVQDALVAAYNELRNEEAMKKFGKVYADLPEDQKAAIREYYPQMISEAEPKRYGAK